MSDRCTMPDDCYAAVLDAVQRAVIDKSASKATRRAAFSVLLVLLEAGGEASKTSLSSAARDRSARGETRTLTGLFWKALPVRL
jgi:hypothetical protein